MLEKLAWYILARQKKKYLKARKYHEADHIDAVLSVRVQKECYLCCILENTDWLAWAERFGDCKDNDGCTTKNESWLRDVVRRDSLD